MNHSLRALLLASMLLASCRSADIQPAYDIAPKVAAARSIMQRPDVASALRLVDADRGRIVDEWRALTEIPAPSGHEAARAQYVERALQGMGVDVTRDGAGNVIAVRKGKGSGKHVVFDAHLDTVFAHSTDVKTRIEDGRLHAPGVGDNTRNVASLIAMIRAMHDAQVETAGDITFLFTVEEETTFRGVEQFIADKGKSVDRFVALDGGFNDFTYGGIGIYWDRYHILGPGGHTRSGTPPYSAALPVARAIDRLYRLRIPRGAWLNVGMLGGADVFNAKASDAWLSVDLRSNDGETLHRLDREVERIVRQEAARDGMQMRRENVSKSEVAKLPGHRTSEMVLTTEGVWRAFGATPEISDTASNHASVAILSGIPAISTGTAPCRGAHSVRENCEIDPILTGTKRNIVLAVALSGG
ncbi:MAG TPA: M20/M25/M40 family metallo-hydrolase [Thermoanaerobaculia bacterium]|nr:M20/M25/M40 family metallo-hydrolase [Thermoanaerobaculia bacterium]